MKFMRNFLVMSMLLFFIGCSAWPILNPGPGTKKKTSIYPIPLPGQTTTSIAAVRIASDTLAALGNFTLAPGSTKTLKAIDRAGADISSAITWSSSSTPTATIAATGIVTAVAIGETTIIATHATLTPAATVKLTVTALGTSILAFDGKEFKEISSVPTNVLNEEK